MLSSSCELGTCRASLVFPEQSILLVVVLGYIICESHLMSRWSCLLVHMPTVALAQQSQICATIPCQQAHSGAECRLKPVPFNLLFRCNFKLLPDLPFRVGRHHLQRMEFELCRLRATLPCFVLLVQVAALAIALPCCAELCWAVLGHTLLCQFSTQQVAQCTMQAQKSKQGCRTANLAQSSGMEQCYTQLVSWGTVSRDQPQLRALLQAMQL